MKIKSIELAKILNVSRQAVSDQIKKGKLVRDKDGLIDFNNNINKNFLVSKGVNIKTGKRVLSKVKKTKAATKKTKASLGGKNKKEKVEPIVTPVVEMDDADDFETLSGLPERMANMTLRQLVLKYGGPMQLKSYTDILDKIMGAMKKDVDIQERRRVLIPKEFTVSYLIQYLDICNNQIFDYPDSIIEQIIAEVKADEKKARLKIPEKIRKDTTKIFKEAKRNIQRALKQLQAKYDNDSASN